MKAPAAIPVLAAFLAPATAQTPGPDAEAGQQLPVKSIEEWASTSASPRSNPSEEFAMLSRSIRTVLTAVVFFSASQALAQNYPTKPVRVLVGLAAGGGVDLIARIITPRLAESLGKPFIVENRPGNGSILAIETVLRSAPDGYTLLFSPSGAMAMNPTIYRKLSYSPTKDFAPVALAVTFPLIVSVNANLPIRSVADLVGWLKANPGKGNCSGSSRTFQLATMLLTSKTGTECTFIQYNFFCATFRAKDGPLQPKNGEF